MTGLRDRRRDAELPSRAGDAGLAPLPPDQVARLLTEHLLTPEAAATVTAVAWTFARWKPGTSLSCGYRVSFADGTHEAVHVKRYASDKARHLEAQAASVEREVQQDLRAADRARWGRHVLADPAAGLVVWVFPADRVLPGLPRLLDMPRTKRLVASLGLFDGARIRSHRSRTTLLRYKPERRAVFRLDLILRGPGDVRRPATLAARVLPPAQAQRVLAARQACDPVAPMVALLGCEARTGLLFEPWCEGQVFAPDSFDHAREAATTLAGLHSARAPDASPPQPAPLADLAPLFQWDRSLAAAFAGATEAPAAERVTWIHGDFHADQLVRTVPDGALRLLDLDALRPGDPAADLASWVADHLAEEPEVSLAEAAAPLLAGYEAGGAKAPSQGRLHAAVSAELVRRAAATLRRLEQGAVLRAAGLLERARFLAPSGSVFG